MADQTPYEILGVSSSATQDEIRSAYRKLAKQLHPDLNPGNKKAEERFKKIASAYELVGSEDSRRKYEQEKAQQAEQEATFRNARRGRGGAGPFYYETQQGNPGSRYGQSFESDMGFDPSVFEDLFRQQRGHTGPAPETYLMEISLADSIRGAEKEFTLPTGKRLSVKIPAGVTAGTKLRFGGAARSGGDVFFETQIRPEPGYRVEGEDLVSDLAVEIPDAIVGSELRVPTVDGPILLKVPPHVDTGQRIRVPGKGLLDRKSGKRGNQIYVVSLRMPKVVSPELENAARQQKGSA